MRPKILFHSYGHTRIEDPEVPRNSVLLTNYGALQGCQQAGDVIDISPPVLRTGIDWANVGRIDRVVDADLLYCQAGQSLEVINQFQRNFPGKPVVLQRDSTHAEHHLQVMRAELDRHGFTRDVWQHQYERDGESLLRRELEEYSRADHVFVLSRFVESTFTRLQSRERRLPKVVYFGPQLADETLWPFHAWSERRPMFTVLIAGSIGLRKATLELLAGWREFVHSIGMNASMVQLLIAGVNDAQDPPGVGKRAPDEPHLPSLLEHAFAMTPRVERLGWVDMRNMSAFYRQAHLYVNVAHEEGSTMPGVEAAFSGCAIAAVPESGIDVPAIQINSRDPAALKALFSRCFDSLVHGDGALKSIAADARVFADNMCTMRAYSARVASLVKEAIG